MKAPDISVSSFIRGKNSLSLGELSLLQPALATARQYAIQSFSDKSGDSSYRQTDVTNLLIESRIAHLLLGGNMRTLSQGCLPILCVTSSGGLANRIRNIAALLVAKSFLNKASDLYCVWAPDLACPILMEDLFDKEMLNTKGVCIYGVHNLPVSQHKSLSEIYDPFYDPVGWWNVWELTCGALVSEQPSWQQFHEHYKNALKQLFSCVHPQIHTLVDKFIEHHSCTGRFLGVHIRATDFRNHYKVVYPDRDLASVDDFLRELSDVTMPVYLACDDQNVASEFTQRYSGRVFNRELNWTNSYRQSSVLDALIDLLILSKSSGIIGTYGSSFSEMASELASVEIRYL